MTNIKDELVLVPIEVLRVIPLYNGDKNKLNLFLRKCEYVIDMYKGNEAQNLYLLHTVTSRLVDDAAELLSERGDIETWSQLKELLLENYSDPRGEDSIAVEFESLKIKPYQSLLKFYNFLQTTHKTLISKIDTQDESIKANKETLYNKMALNVFMFNLPKSLVQILRIKSPNSLEEAYNIVIEEISFFKQYNKKQCTVLNTVPDFKCFYPFGAAHPLLQQQPFARNIGFGSPASQIQSANHNQKNNGSSLFGSAQSHQKSGVHFGSTTSIFGSQPQSFGTQSQTFGAKPQAFGTHPQGFGTQPQAFGSQPQAFGSQPQPFSATPLLPSEQNNQNFLKSSDNIVKNMKTDIHAFHNDEEE